MYERYGERVGEGGTELHRDLYEREGERGKVEFVCGLDW